MHVGYYLLLSVCLRHGFLRLIQGCLRLVPDSALHAGPPCSSWIWLNRGTSGRSVNKVMGDTSQPSVLESNMNLACIKKKCKFQSISIFDQDEWTETEDHESLCSYQHSMHLSMRACHHRAAPVVDYEACEIFQIHCPDSWATCGLEVGELAGISVVFIPIK